MTQREYTDEEYYMMVNELLESDGAVTDTALRIAEAVLYKYIKLKCYDDRLLRTNDHFDEIMQKIRSKVAKKILNRYVKKDGPFGPVNDDVDGLRPWLRTLGVRTLIDYKRKLTGELTDKNKFLQGDVWYYLRLLRGIEKPSENVVNLLKKCFFTVADMSTAPYKSLTWILHSYLMMETGATRKDATKKLADTFGDRPLVSMRNKAFRLLVHETKYSWLGFTKGNFTKIDARLKKTQDDGMLLGETLFRDCFMQKGATSSISDWLNKINKKIRQVIDNEASKH